MIYELPSHVANQLKDFFNQFDFIDKVVVFGSRARHDCTPKSDIDLCVYSLEMTDKEFSKLRFEIDELPILYKLDLVHFEKVNKELQDNVERDGKLLFIKYVKLEDITINLDNKRKPLNKESRQLMKKGKLYPYFGANGIVDYINEFRLDEEILCIAEDCGAWGENEKCSYIINEKCSVNNHAHVLKMTINIDINFLKYYLNKVNLTYVITGTTRGKLTKTALNNIEIFLPTLTKQKKIAEVLDKASELITLRKEAIKKLDELSKSIFLDMFGDLSKNSKKFNTEKLEELILIDAKMVQPNTKKYQNFLHIGSDRIEKNTGKLLNCLTVKEEKLISKKFIFDDRFILYSKIRPYLNKVILVDFIGLCSADIYPIRPKNEKINRIFLWKLLLSSYFVKYTESLPSRASIPKLNRNELLNFEFPLPPKPLQNKFATIIEKIEEQKALYEQELEKLQENFDSLLDKNFS